MEKRALMYKGVFISLLCFSICTVALPQTTPWYSRPDSIAKSAPDSVEESILSLSHYFNSKLTSKKDLIRAFYYWTANEIAYDAENMFNFRSSSDPAKLISETLETRKAVCQGYSEVFNELCQDAGIESYIVLGFTKQNGNVVNLNHAWVVAQLDSNWYFFDPTWGSGYLMNGQFYKKFTNEYFKIRPSELIKSHMPFDPLWQCLFYPISAGEFYKNDSPRKDAVKFFNFPDSISVYNHLTKPEKQTNTLRRIEKNGVVNNSIFEYVKYLKQSLDIERANQQNERQNELVNKFNIAVNNYNIAAILFNDYIGYWNRQFKPVKPDAEIKHMLDTCDVHLAISRSILADIVPQEENLRNNMEMLAKPIAGIQKQVNEQREFLREYFATSKAYRGGLFRKYNWLGAPGK